MNPRNFIAATGFALVCSGLVSFSLIAKPLEYPKLIDPERISIGPDDNYQGVYSAPQQAIIYTKLRTMSPRLYVLKAGSGLDESLISESYDTKDAAISADGKRIAYISFEHGSRGDLCHRALDGEESDAVCYRDLDVLNREPFWLDPNRIAYVAQDFSSGVWRLASRTLSSGKEETLYQGQVSSPAASTDGRFIVFSAAGSSAGSLMLLPRSSGKPGKPVTLALGLPGRSGYPQFSKDGTYLYFTQYLNDTNRDFVIDGNDHGVIFRVPFAKLRSAKVKVHPEQLTSVEQNCGYPQPADDALILSCAFRGTIDIYRLPLSGIVPAHWSKAQLEEAYQAARLYEQRTLFANQIIAKHGASDALWQRLFFSHLQLQEFEAAEDYLLRLPENSVIRREAPAVRLWIRQWQTFLAKPEARMTAAYLQALSEMRQEISALAAGSFMRMILEAQGLAVENRVDEAKALFARIDVAAEKAMELQHFYVELAAFLHKDPAGRRDAFLKVIRSEASSKRTKAHWIGKVLESFGEDQKSLEARLAEVERLGSTFSEDSVAKKLIRVESACLRTMLEKDPKAKGVPYSELGKELIALKAEREILNVAHVRVSELFRLEEDPQYLSKTAVSWLGATQRSEMEYDFAARQFIMVDMDKAYGHVHADKSTAAEGAFYDAAMRLDDLEGHHGYLALAYKRAGSAEIQKVYGNLKKRDTIGDSRIYADALLMILETESAAAKKGGELDRGRLQEAADMLAKMPRDLENPALRDLLLGYVLTELTILSSKESAFAYDPQTAQLAQRHLTLALDLALDNQRIAAAAYENLGRLNFHTRNFGLAADFFAKRYAIGFDALDDRKRAAWTLAEAYYLARQYREAQILIAELLNELKPADRYYLPFLQKRALYAALSEEYELAILLGDQLRPHEGKMSAENLAKYRLTQGYALFKAKRCEAADPVLRGTLKALDGKGVRGREARLARFEPDRGRLIANGLLALCHSGAKKAEAKAGMGFRAERRRVLKSHLDDADRIYLNADDLHRSLIKDYLHDLQALYRTENGEGIAKLMPDLLQTTLTHIEEGAYPSDVAVVSALRNYFSVRLAQKAWQKTPSKAETRLVSKLMRSFFEGYEDVLPNQVGLFAVRLPIEMMWEAYQTRYLAKKHLDAALSRLLKEQYGAAIEDEAPEEYETAKALAAELLQMIAAKSANKKPAEPKRDGTY